MSLKQFFIFASAYFLVYTVYSQNCYNNRLKLQKLEKGEEVDSYTFPAAQNPNSASLVISKTGDGPDLSAYDANTIWIGKNSFLYESSEISLSFLNPVYNASFVLSYFNNDATGNEEIHSIRVFNEKEEDVSTSCRIAWITGTSSGHLLSDNQATRFEEDTKSVHALEGKCCGEASGKVEIRSPVPFRKIMFVHRKISGSPNGVLLTGELSYCVAERVVPKKTQVKKEIKITEPPTVKRENTPLKQGKKIPLKNVFFKQGLAELLPESYPELDKLVSTMKENKSMQIEVQGHTDIEGNAGDNLKLSEQRAEVVRTYLTSKGIHPARIKAKGFGGTKPLIPASDIKNRRVEFMILKI